MLAQLYEMQKLDTRIDQCRDRIQLLGKMIGDQTDLIAINKDLDKAKNNLLETRTAHKSHEAYGVEMRDKLKRAEGKLYGGLITNLREMESNQKESETLNSKIQELDDILLETLVTLEEVGLRVITLEDKERQSKARWELAQSEMSTELKELKVEQEHLEIERRKVSSTVKHTDIAVYNKVRGAKGGIAIAEIEKGMCSACRVTLPTNQTRRARAGRELVLCNSCGRILYAN